MRDSTNCHKSALYERLLTINIKTKRGYVDILSQNG